MADSELQTLKEDIAEIKAGVKEVSTGLNDLRVLIAGDYVKREEFDEAKKENEKTHQNLINWIIGICVSLLGVVGYLASRR